jgi:hypothetical protein
MRIKATDCIKIPTLKSTGMGDFSDNGRPSMDVAKATSQSVPQMPISSATRSSVRSIGRRMNLIPID